MAGQLIHLHNQKQSLYHLTTVTHAHETVNSPSRGDGRRVGDKRSAVNGLLYGDSNNAAAVAFAVDDVVTGGTLTSN